MLGRPHAQPLAEMESKAMNRKIRHYARRSGRGRKLSPRISLVPSLFRNTIELEDSSMKKMFLVLLVVLGVAGLAIAQTYSPSTDVLGAHLNYGRGCAACHAPHSGAWGNGNAKTADPSSGNIALWGEDLTSLKGVSITTGGGKHGEVLPSSSSAGTPDVQGMLACLSCHDGNFASRLNMRN